MGQTAVLYGRQMNNNGHSCHDVDSRDETVQRLLALMYDQLKELSNKELHRGISQTVQQIQNSWLNEKADVTNCNGVATPAMVNRK